MKKTKARVYVGLGASSQAYDTYLRFLVHRGMTDQSELAHQHAGRPSGLHPPRNEY